MVHVSVSDVARVMASLGKTAPPPEPTHAPPFHKPKQPCCAYCGTVLQPNGATCGYCGAPNRGATALC